MEKKVYEAPEVTKVEIDFSDRIVAEGCGLLYFENCGSVTNWHNS